MPERARRLSRRILKESSRCRAGLRSAQPFEDFNLYRLHAWRCGRAAKNQLGGMIRMAQRVGHRDVTAERHAHDDGPFYLERIAQGLHVIAPLREFPLRGVFAPIAAAVAAMIEVDDLRDVRELRVGGFED